jgi:L-ribulokinase
VYEQLYPLYRDVYFALGTRDAAPAALGQVFPQLRKIAAQVQRSHQESNLRNAEIK